MPNDGINIWVDHTFSTTADSAVDSNVEFYHATPENVGSFSIPVVYNTPPPEYDEVDVNIESFFKGASLSGLKNVPMFYFEPALIFLAGAKDYEINSSFDPAISGTRIIPNIYSTGFSAIYSTIDSRATFIGGLQFITNTNIPTYFINSTSYSGIIEWIVNYINFSGDITTSGLPVPTRSGVFDYPAEYGKEYYGDIYGALNRIVDVTFAGWVGFPIRSDIWSVLAGALHDIDTDILTVSGSVTSILVDLFSGSLFTTYTLSDIYCSSLKQTPIDLNVSTTSGTMGWFYWDAFSANQNIDGLKVDIDLFPIKISNFSLDIGEYVTTSGFVYVDLFDDTCPISTSGTYFELEGSVLPVSFTTISGGERMYFYFGDTFNSIEGPIALTAHVENTCGDIIESDFYLTFGYLVEYYNSPDLHNKIDYGFKNKVAVRVTAENYATCPKLDSLAWEFESREQYNRDLPASIVGIFRGTEQRDMLAAIYPVSTAYFYGKEIHVVINAKDFAGNSMEPFILMYRIENKPDD